MILQELRFRFLFVKNKKTNHKKAAAKSDSLSLLLFYLLVLKSSLETTVNDIQLHRSF